jgi:hypothetical protein
MGLFLWFSMDISNSEINLLIGATLVGGGAIAFLLAKRGFRNGIR